MQRVRVSARKRAYAISRAGIVCALDYPHSGDQIGATWGRSAVLVFIDKIIYSDAEIVSYFIQNIYSRIVPAAHGS